MFKLQVSPSLFPFLQDRQISRGFCYTNFYSSILSYKLLQKVLLKGNHRQNNVRIHRWMDWREGGARFGNHEREAGRSDWCPLKGHLSSAHRLVRNRGRRWQKYYMRVGVANLPFARGFHSRVRIRFCEGWTAPFFKENFCCENIMIWPCDIFSHTVFHPETTC